MSSFQIILDGSALSYATQSLFDLTKFYSALKDVISVNPSLNSLNLKLVSPNTYPTLVPKNLFHLTLNKRIPTENRTYLQNAIKSFITQNSIRNYFKIIFIL